MTNPTPDLLPCPFCGGEADFSLGKTGEGEDWHYLECAECETMGPRVQYAAHNIAIKDALSSAWNTRADLAAVQPAPVCPECSNTGLRDTGGVYPWGEGIFVACDHDDPQPDPRDEVIARLVDALRNCDGGLGALGVPRDAKPRSTARAALAAVKGENK